MATDTDLEEKLIDNQISTVCEDSIHFIYTISCYRCTSLQIVSVLLSSFIV